MNVVTQQVGQTHRAVTDSLTMVGAEIEWVRSNEVDGRAERPLCQRG